MRGDADPGLEMVREFHEAFSCHIGTHPHVPDEPVHLALTIYHQEAARLAEELKAASAQAGGSLLLIRLQLIQEELAELAAGFISRDPVECLDALNDLSYVVDGTYLTLGLQDGKLPGMREVHRSNMSKLGPDGKPVISEAGRVVKGPDYEPPDLHPIVEELMPRVWPEVPPGPWRSSAALGINASTLGEMAKLGLLEQRRVPREGGLVVYEWRVPDGAA
jgi:predicted HAD superfamily Cof-like phosphohydrolase